jgi:hypothetical protein
MKVKTRLVAGMNYVRKSGQVNHNARKALVVKSQVRAGGIHLTNHNGRKALVVRSKVRAGGVHIANHNGRKTS